jgi:hypothetical protein
LDCSTPPKKTCSNGDFVTYGVGTCSDEHGDPTCVYPETHKPCTLATNNVCYSYPDRDDVCGNPEGNPHPCSIYGCPPHATCVDDATLATGPGTCSFNNCIYVTDTHTDCTLLVTPPAAKCVGTILTTYAATGSCLTNQAVCGYASVTTDCAITNQVCDAVMAACVGP